MVSSLSPILQCAGYVSRKLCKGSAFTAAAIVSLALGIGAGTAVFSLVNETFARKFSSDKNPLERTMHVLTDNWRIVGVCRDAKYINVKEAVPPIVYFPFRQICRIATIILREALLLSAFGVAAGVSAALVLARFIQSQLYGAAPNDPVTLIGTGTLLIVVAVLSAWIPAHRAAKVDPLVALRNQ